MKRTRVEIPCNNGDEYDVFSKWRKILCFTQRAGACAAIKTGYNRRVRRKIKEKLNQGLTNDF